MFSFSVPPKSVHLRVAKSSEPILGAISAPEGSTRRIECVAVGGSPPPLLKWYLGEVEMPEGAQGWKLLNFSHGQELSQQASWLLIGCTEVNIKSDTTLAMTTTH